MINTNPYFESRTLATPCKWNGIDMFRTICVLSVIVTKAANSSDSHCLKSDVYFLQQRTQSVYLRSDDHVFPLNYLHKLLCRNTACSFQWLQKSLTNNTRKSNLTKTNKYVLYDCHWSTVLFHADMEIWMVFLPLCATTNITVEFILGFVHMIDRIPKR